MADRWHDEDMHAQFPFLSRSSRQPRTGFFSVVAVSAAALLLAGCGTNPSTSNDAQPKEPQRLTPTVVADFPWDSTSFTQGLEVDANGDLIVGTGMYGQSRIYRTNLAGGQRDSQDLPPEQFGEGLTRTGDTVWQLTWKAGTAIKRNAHTLKETGTASYDGEGWGLCALPGKLVMSDGSGDLTFRDPDTFDATGTLTVTNNGAATTMLNELECVADGPLAGVWANVWQSDEIYRIDPESGQVTAAVEASGLLTEQEAAQADVLNGIAHIPGTDRMYLTGKYWPRVFEVEFTGQ